MVFKKMQRYKVIILHNGHVLLIRYFESNDLYKNLSFYCVFRRRSKNIKNEENNDTRDSNMSDFSNK